MLVTNMVSEKFRLILLQSSDLCRENRRDFGDFEKNQREVLINRD